MSFHNEQRPAGQNRPPQQMEQNRPPQQFHPGMNRPMDPGQRPPMRPMGRPMQPINRPLNQSSAERPPMPQVPRPMIPQAQRPMNPQTQRPMAPQGQVPLNHQVPRPMNPSASERPPMAQVPRPMIPQSQLPTNPQDQDFSHTTRPGIPAAIRPDVRPSMRPNATPGPHPSQNSEMVPGRPQQIRPGPSMQSNLAANQSRPVINHTGSLSQPTQPQMRPVSQPMRPVPMNLHQPPVQSQPHPGNSSIQQQPPMMRPPPSNRSPPTVQRPLGYSAPQMPAQMSEQVPQQKQSTPFVPAATARPLVPDTRKRMYPDQMMPSVAGSMNNLNDSFSNLSTGNQSMPFALMGAIPPIDDLNMIHAPISPSSPYYCKSTLNSVPRNSQLHSKCRVPFGITITPYPIGQGEVPQVSGQITRCKICRAYINSFVEFVDQGTRWKCNMCSTVNDVPSYFDYDERTRRPIDRQSKPELNHSVVEFLAGQDYIVRAPQPPVYLFLLEVTYESVASGMVACVSRSILESLDQIPNDNGLVKVGFITFDSTMQFYNLNSALSEPQMIVVPDFEELTGPYFEDVIVNLNEARPALEKLLEKLGSMFSATRNTSNCFGAALKIATKLLQATGGTLCSFLSTMPNIHTGALKQREDIKSRGTPRDSKLLEPLDGLYKDITGECTQYHVAVNLFLFPSAFMDISTLSSSARYTGGAIYYYPHFSASKMADSLKVGSDINSFLKLELGHEAVIRVRASKGLTLNNYHGSFFLKSIDLLSLPNVNPHHSISAEVHYEEALRGDIVCFQTAVLFTSTNGERKIRVITHALPVVDTLAQVFLGIDQVQLVNFLGYAAADRALMGKLEDARDGLANKCIEILAAYKHSISTSGGQNSQLMICENMRLFPLLVLGLLKSPAFRVGVQIPIDQRAYLMVSSKTWCPSNMAASIHPRFYALHTMDPDCGLPGQDDKIKLPSPMNLSSEKLERHGFYLLDDGVNIYLWVGQASPPSLASAVFDVPSYEALEAGTISLNVLDNPFSKKIYNIVSKIKEIRGINSFVILVKEDCEPRFKYTFLSMLIEDKSDTHPSYTQWIQMLKEKVAKK